MTAERPESRPEAGAERRPDEPPEAGRREPAQPAAGEGAPLTARLAVGGVRIIALIGVLALAVIAAAILVSQDVDGWIVGLAVGVGVQILTMFILFSRRFAARD